MIILVVLQVSVKSIPELAMMSTTYVCGGWVGGGVGSGSRKRERSAEVSQKYYREI